MNERHLTWVRALTRVVRGPALGGRRGPPDRRAPRRIDLGRGTLDRARARAESSATIRHLRQLIPVGALTLAALTMAGYVMGLGRDKILAHTFGAGAELDAYNAAFVLPELALDVLVAGGLVAPFVPLFLGLRGDAAEDAERFGRTVLGLACGVMVLASGLLFVFAPATAQVIVPGFPPEQQALYIGLFRVMCLTPPIFAASLVIGEVLVAERRFLWYGLAPLMYSAGIAAGTLVLSGSLGIYAAAWGAVGGAVAHLGIRLAGLRGSAFRARPALSLRTRGLGEFIRLVIPKMVSQPLEPLVFLYYTSLASSLAAGSVSSMNYARNFYGVPVGLIGASFAIAAFPTLSAAANAGDRLAFARTFRRTLVSISVLSTLAGLALFAVSGLLIGTLLAGGAFDAEDVARTALMLAVFALAVPLESVMNLLARAVYATRDTVLPTLAALAGFIALVAVSQALIPRVGMAAIPASYAAGMGVRVVSLAAAVAIRAPTIGPAARSLPRPVPARAVVPAVPGLVRSSHLRRRAVLVLVAALLVAGTASAAERALNGTTIAAEPLVTPWAREFPLASHPVPSLPPTPLPSVAAVITAPPSTTPPSASPSPSPSPTPKPGPFAMDLYQKGDFVGEIRDTWCVPAAMQTSINIMSAGADRTEGLQARLYALAYSLAPGNAGGPDAAGWPQGLTKLGYGHFALEMASTMTAAVKAVAKAIRMTDRPGGLIVWYGWHSWVVSGFKATADPATTDAFTVTGLYIEDVWYNRLSNIWGWSFPPDTFDKVSDLPIDYKPFHQSPEDPRREHQYLFVVPLS